MSNETGVLNPLSVYTLIPLADFKAIPGIDDREETISRFCLNPAVFTTEQYSKRRLFLNQKTGSPGCLHF
jgi:hypothetical protein